MVLVAKRGKILFRPMQNESLDEAADNLIADALLDSYGDKAIGVAQAQLEEANENRRDVWMNVVKILSERESGSGPDRQSLEVRPPDRDIQATVDDSEIDRRQS